ncbi:MAG: hypothetical protein JWO98_317 [Frankiales bacterium]|nr:hypothetical protein [Frankiales bacterium]
MPPLSSQKVLDLIKAPATGVNNGRARFTAQSGRGATPAQKQFAEDMANLPAPQRTSTAHPADTVRGAQAVHKALSPSDLMWLQRLPQDPAQVPFQDAGTVAAMAHGLAINLPMGHSDRRLIDSVWQPIKSFHDKRAADAALGNARQPLPPIPASALPALADAVAAEVPQLNDSEVLARASELLRQALEERGAARAQAIQKAEAELAKLDASDTARTSLIA